MTDCTRTDAHDHDDPRHDGRVPCPLRYRLPLRTRLIVLWRRLTRQAIPYRDRWS